MASKTAVELQIGFVDRLLASRATVWYGVVSY